MATRPLLVTEIPGGELFSRGKVRDTWRVPPSSDGPLLLMVTTDRISAFDVVMSRGVPDLGRIRNQISNFWFDRLRHLCPNHIFSSKQELCVAAIGEENREPNDLIGRCMLVYQADVFPVECVVRRYLAGSAWENYQVDGTVCGIKLPPGLREAEKLAQPIFTPSTKARTGHDENISFDTLVRIVGGEAAEIMRETSLRIYAAAAQWAEVCGIIIADTKLEYGRYGRQKDRFVLVDELLTPDSSRFWDFATYKPGGPQPSFDKQPLRDWLRDSGWDRNPPPPSLPDEVIAGTRERYIEAYERLVGKVWPDDSDF